jgi:hypothetical protein
MQVRVLNLDGSLPVQKEFMTCQRPALFDFQAWGPVIRMACSFGRFRRFERGLHSLLGDYDAGGPITTFCGSGDFHHVSLALLRRIRTPINLLVIDKHPDWMRGIPFLHCGTWVYHAAQLPQVQRVFHVGGDLDFDNSYQWLAPWSMLRAGKIVVLPGIRRFQRGAWKNVPNQPVRCSSELPATSQIVSTLVQPYRKELASFPLYISLDKDVMPANEAIVNWDSGYLSLAEVGLVLNGFLQAARGKLAGMDCVGDWSPVHLRGSLRRVMHWMMHPSLAVDTNQASRRNGHVNQEVLKWVRTAIEPRLAAS